MSGGVVAVVGVGVDGRDPVALGVTKGVTMRVVGRADVGGAADDGDARTIAMGLSVGVGAGVDGAVEVIIALAVGGIIAVVVGGSFAVAVVARVGGAGAIGSELVVIRQATTPTTATAATRRPPARLFAFAGTAAG